MVRVQLMIGIALDYRGRGACLALLLASVACGGSVPWVVTRQSGPPSTLAGTKVVFVKFDYGSLHVAGKAEPEWVDEHVSEEPEYASKTWPDLKHTFEQNYMDGLVHEWGGARRLDGDQAPPEGSAVLTVHLNSITPGRYIPFASKETRFDTTLSFDVNEEPSDEIMMQMGLSPSPVMPSLFQHAENIGLRLGLATGEFIETKAKL